MSRTSAQRLGLRLRLDEIKEIIAFRDRGEQPCSYVADVLERHVSDLDGRIREMRALRDQLSELHARAVVGAQSDRSYCAVIEQPLADTREPPRFAVPDAAWRPRSR